MKWTNPISSLLKKRQDLIAVEAAKVIQKSGGVSNDEGGTISPIIKRVTGGRENKESDFLPTPDNIICFLDGKSISPEVFDEWLSAVMGRVA